MEIIRCDMCGGKILRNSFEDGNLCEVCQEDVLLEGLGTIGPLRKDY